MKLKYSITKGFFKIAQKKFWGKAFLPFAFTAVLPFSFFISANAKQSNPDFLWRIWIMNDWTTQSIRRDITSVCIEELERTKRILERADIDSPKLDSFNAEFKNLEKSKEQFSDEFYFKLRDLKRRIILADRELEGLEEIVCIDSPMPQGSESPHQCRFRTENTAPFGGRLLSVKNFKSGAPIVKNLTSKMGSVALTRPDVSFDAKKILVGMRTQNDTNYHLYECDIDENSFRKITKGKYNDFDPIYLPDGGFAFSSSRTNTYIRCGSSIFRAFALARCDNDGSNLRFISTNAEVDLLPTLSDDGSIMYCRWEYVDRNVFRVQSVWTVNPDGSNPQAFWGAQSTYPDMVLGAMKIPETKNYIFMSAGHHNIFNSGLGVIKPEEGLNYPNGIYNLTPHLAWTEVGDGYADKSFDQKFNAPKCYGAFCFPRPLGKKYFLVSAYPSRRLSNSTVPSGNWNRFALYIMDYDGNMELLYRGENHIFHANVLAPREKPPMRESDLAKVGKRTSKNMFAPNGTLYSANVYENSGIASGSAKYLRVVEQGALTFDTGIRNSSDIFARVASYIFDRNFRFRDDRIMSAIMGTAHWGASPFMSLINEESWKKIHSEVEIEKDGSVNFEVPAMRAVYFQLLDKDRKVLQTMRSSTHAQSGESRGCLGCHATMSNKAPPTRPSLALRKKAVKPNSPFGDSTFGFERNIQPILDKHCVLCHKDGGDAPFTLEKTKVEGTPFSKSYVHLLFGYKPAKLGEDMRKRTLANPIFNEYAYQSTDDKRLVRETVLKPMSVLSYTSPLIRKIESGKHNGIKLSQDEMNVLKAWIDLNCTYLDEEDILSIPDDDEKKYFSDKNAQGLSYAPKMRTSPDIDRAFLQDGLDSPDDRLPKNPDGSNAPAIIYENGKRKVCLPE